MQSLGYDNEGRQIILISAKYLKPDMSSTEELIRYFFYIFDTALKEN
jgi:hypothetical protein